MCVCKLVWKEQFLAVIFMVLTEITWPYGGREVLISFSFSRWADLIPMVMTEDSGFVFRDELPVGEHQYKFLVDGEWRYNDQLDFAQGDNGSINNYIVVEPDMDIDEPLPLLDSDVDIFRRRLSMHLASHTIFELMPPSGKVPVLAAEMAVKEAFHLMHKQGLAAVPIQDSNRHQISAMLTASDFILIFMEIHRNYGMLTDEQLQVHTISSWKEGKHQPNGEAVGDAQWMFGRPVIQAGPDESLRDVAMRILQYGISTIPIIHSTEEESCPWWLLHVACLGGILKHMCRYFQNNLDYLPLLQHPVGSLSLGTWASKAGGARHLLALHPNKTLGFALNILIEENISSIPIVDGDGSLINIYSRSDITSLAKDNAYTRIQLDQTIISQVLELADGRNRYHTCTRFDPLYVVMERLSDPVVRRLIVIDAGSQHVEGIITLSDVFRFILN